MATTEAVGGGVVVFAALDGVLPDVPAYAHVLGPADFEVHDVFGMISRGEAFFRDEALGLLISPDEISCSDSVSKETHSYLIEDADLFQPDEISAVEHADNQNGNVLEENFSRWTGRGVDVAVIDDGADSTHPCLDISSFSILGEVGAGSLSASVHGTKCCGTVAGGWFAGQRIGVAPLAKLHVGQFHGKQPTISVGVSVSTVEFILLLSWSVFRGVKVVSFSNGVNPQDVSDQWAEALSTVALRLRKTQKCLIFCAAGNRNLIDVDKPVVFPAGLPGFIPVGGYTADRGVAIASLYTNALDSNSLPDLFLGPSNGIKTSVPASRGGHIFAKFRESSAACAYVAGIAALWCERLIAESGDVTSLELLLDSMKGHSTLALDPKGRGWTWCVPLLPD